MRRPTFGVLAVVLAVAGACIPAGANPPGPLDSIDVLGDSITEQAYSGAGGWSGSPSIDTQKIAGAGWEVDDVEGPYAASVAADPPDVTVIALGPNDADPADGGWTLYDIANWYDLLRATPEGSCIVVVLPRHGAGFPAAWATELNEARGYMVDLMAPGGIFEPPANRTRVLMDWNTVTAINPTYLGADGIHLTAVDNDAPAYARQDVYWDGAGNC
jgi:hypothetical protein